MKSVNWTAVGAIAAALALFGIPQGYLNWNLNRGFDAVDARFDAVDARFDAVDAQNDAQNDAIDAQNDAIDARFDAVDAQFEVVHAQYKLLNERFDALIERFDVTDSRVRGAHQGVERKTRRFNGRTRFRDPDDRGCHPNGSGVARNAGSLRH